MPLISIGLPVYNSERYVEKSIESLLGQTFKDFELIISDNCSTDSTMALCQKYSKIDKRVKYFRNQRNIGIAENFNRVFKLSSGKYFRWNTSDDYCNETLIEKCLAILEKDESVALCYPKTVLVDGKENVINKYDDNLNLFYNEPTIRAMKLIKNARLCNVHYGLMRSSIVKKTSLIENYFSSDMLFLFQMALKGKFFELPEYLFYRRIHSKSSHGKADNIDELIEYFNPNYKNRYFNTKLLQRYIETVFQADLNFIGKITLLKFLFIFAVHSRDIYFKEIKLYLFEKYRKMV